MPAFSVSSVDTGADTLTSTGVAAAGGAEGTVLTTGDRFRLRNVGGALPAATPSLAGATDYFARRSSDDAIQIYDTHAHAVAGGGTGLVNITGSGSGTTTIEFSLPYALPTEIAGAGVQARSSIFNAMYNALVALYCLLTGQSQSVWSGIKLVVPLQTHDPIEFGAALAQIPNGSAITFIPAGMYWAFGTSTDHLICQIILPVGFTFSSWTLHLAKTSTSGTVTAKLFDFNKTTGASPVQIGATQTNNANNPGVITLGQAIGATTVAGHSYYIDVGPGSGVTGDAIYGWSITP